VFAEVTVLANDKGTYNTYRIFFSVDSSYTNAKPEAVKIAGEFLGNFDPGITEYNVGLPAGTFKYFGLSVFTQVERGLR